MRSSPKILREIWNKYNFENPFLDEVFDSMMEYFVDLDIYKNRIDFENSDGFLEVYVANKLLSSKKSLIDIISFYKNLFKSRNLTKNEADIQLMEFLNSKK